MQETSGRAWLPASVTAPVGLLSIHQPPSCRNRPQPWVTAVHSVLHITSKYPGAGENARTTGKSAASRCSLSNIVFKLVCTSAAASGDCSWRKQEPLSPCSCVTGNHSRIPAPSWIQYIGLKDSLSPCYPDCINKRLDIKTKWKENIFNILT